MFVDGGGRWEPDPEPEPERRRRGPLPWRTAAWIVGLCWLLALGGEIGGFVAYLCVLVTVTVGALLIERAVARSAWGGMQDHRQ